jgi:D-amino-acid oxidase
MVESAIVKSQPSATSCRNLEALLSEITFLPPIPNLITHPLNYSLGGGTILGGCLQVNNYESQPDLNLATRIMKRSVELCPALTDGKGIEALSIIRHGVGLRPMRQGGPRVEKEKIDGVWVVHQYGHGGYGYQASYGSAYVAVKLAEEIAGTVKSRL